LETSEAAETLDLIVPADILSDEKSRFWIAVVWNERECFGYTNCRLNEANW
jgi:hypothetical protein